jgi:hypothetical protein
MCVFAAPAANAVRVLGVNVHDVDLRGISATRSRLRRLVAWLVSQRADVVALVSVVSVCYRWC